MGATQTERSVIGVLVDQLLGVYPEPSPAHVPLVLPEHHSLDDSSQLNYKSFSDLKGFTTLIPTCSEE